MTNAFLYELLVVLRNDILNCELLLEVTFRDIC